MQRSWLAPLVLFGALSITRAANAQVPPEGGPAVADRAEARRHFQLGVAAYNGRRWAAALEEFQSAYRLAPHPSVRVNMANCYANLDRPTDALFHFEQFLAESPSAPEAQVTEVESQINQLRTRVGELQLVVTPANAAGLAVTLDGQAVSLGRPVHVAPGHHVVEALAEGHTTLHREIDAAAGQAQVLTLALEPVAPPTPPPTPVPIVAPPPTPVVVAPDPVPPPITPPTDTVRRGPPPAVFYAVAGVTGVAAIGWITAGALALSADSDFNATVNQIQSGVGDLPTLQARGRDEAARASQLATWSDVAMGVTLVGAAASVVLFLKTDFRSPVTVGASATAGRGLITVGGSF